MRIVFVGEGKNDHAVVPELVRQHLSVSIDLTTKAWTDIKVFYNDPSSRRQLKAKGLKKRTAQAIRDARNDGFDGLVATVDSNGGGRGSRLNDMKEGRTLANALGVEHLPTALGEATPELEAWLLDDHNAVKDALQLNAESRVPSVSSCSDVKAALDELIGRSRRNEGRIDLLIAIAEKVSLSTGCRTPRDTGYEDFLDDLDRELG